MRFQLSFVFFIITFAIGITEFGGCKKKDNKRDVYIEESTDSRMKYLVYLYGSKEKLEKAAGESYVELRAQAREAAIAQLEVGEALGKIPY